MTRPDHTLARVTLLALVVALATAGTADAKWFGANLKRAANSSATCQSFSFFYVVKSCSWTTSGKLFNPAEAMVVPGTGKLTRVKIKVGPKTGPMRIAILESLRKENSGEAACCIGRKQTKRFRPKRNATTTLKVNIPVRTGFNKKSRIYYFDSLFITMDNASTPIPANIGDPNSDNCSGGWFPAVRPGQENYSGPYGQCGYTILIRAKWEPR